jgi:hypothetical protein
MAHLYCRLSPVCIPNPHLAGLPIRRRWFDQSAGQTGLVPKGLICTIAGFRIKQISAGMISLHFCMYGAYATRAMHTHTHTHTHTAHLLHLGSSPFCTQGVVSWGWETREDIHTAHRQSAMAESRKNLHLGRHHKEAKRKKCLLWECDRCFSSTAIPNTVFMLWNADGSVQYMPNNQIYVLRTIQSPVWYTGQQQACALQCLV